jgi:tryptophan synthase beta chain
VEQTQVTDADSTGASLPDASGHFGPYGGRFVAETLMLPLDELTAAYEKYWTRP